MAASSTSITWLVTGYAHLNSLPFDKPLTRTSPRRASRGIGLEIVRQLLTSPANLVIAACRNPSGASSLAALTNSADAKGALHTIKLDIVDFAGVRAAAKYIAAILGNNGLDYLVNNAGIVSATHPSQCSADSRRPTAESFPLLRWRRTPRSRWTRRNSCAPHVRM